MTTSKCYLWFVFRYSCLCHVTLSVAVEFICCCEQVTAAGLFQGARRDADHPGVNPLNLSI